MIALLRGTVVTGGLGELVLDVGGVGYAVRVAPGAVPATAGAEVTLHTHLAVREDALTLYGFADPAARALFETLLGVTGVGPKVALAAIGTLGATGLRRAVVTEDVSALTVVPGLGRKGAQRMILELRERLGALLVDGVPGEARTGAASQAPTPRTDVAEALAGLGYGAGEVQAVLDRIDGPAAADERPADPEGPAGELTADELLRRALRALGRRT